MASRPRSVRVSGNAQTAPVAPQRTSLQGCITGALRHNWFFGNSAEQAAGARGMVAIYVGVTDGDWFRFLSQRPDITEVNFWQPVDTRRFGALTPGELFLFKLKAPDHFIGGGGLFVGANAYPTSLAWAAFGKGNGVSSLDELRKRVGAYGRRFCDQPFDPTRDPQIRSRVLEEPFFFPREQWIPVRGYQSVDTSPWIPVPTSWSRNLVQGRTYDTETEDGRYLWDAVCERLQGRVGAFAEAARFGRPVRIAPRLGQGGFRVAVTDAYERGCALTREKALPILDAAHIRAYASGGDHEITNGLLLRTDVHRLFDLGFVTVSTDGRFEVGKRLREDFENGDDRCSLTPLPRTQSDLSEGRGDRGCSRGELFSRNKFGRRES